MDEINKIGENIKRSTMILVINNNSKLLFDTLLDSIYKKYNPPKIKISSRKKLLFKLSRIKNKMILLDFDLKKIQFSSSSNDSQKIRGNFLELKDFLTVNGSKLLVKTDVVFYKEKIDFNTFYLSNSIFYLFDLIIFIDKEKLKVIKRDFGVNRSEELKLEQLIRKSKLKKLEQI